MQAVLSAFFLKQHGAQCVARSLPQLKVLLRPQHPFINQALAQHSTAQHSTALITAHDCIAQYISIGHLVSMVLLSLHTSRRLF